MSKGQPIILQEKYYLDYFKYVLSFVPKLYPTIIGEQQQFIDEFYGLSEDAQCLYLRMNTRRGRFFRLSKLQYAEITDVASAKEELLRTGFCRHPSTDDAPEEILRIFTKVEIIFLLEKFSSDSITKSSPRQKLVEQLLPLVDLPSINSLDQVLVQEKLKDVALIKLLFFGHPYGDLSEFVARDVGHLKIPNLDQKSFAPFFQSREELETLWWIFEQYELFKFMEAADISPEELWSWLGKIFPSLLASRKIGGRLLEKFGMKLGQYFESKQWSEAAIVSYQLSTSTDAMTRLLRVLTKEKRWEEASGYALWLTENAKAPNKKIYAPKNSRMDKREDVITFLFC